MKKVLSFIFALDLSAPALAQTTTVPISGFPTAGAANGTEYLLGIQSGNTRKFPASLLFSVFLPGCSGYVYGNAALNPTCSITIPVAALTGQLPAANFPILTGDIQTAGGVLATQISLNAVTYGKIQQVAANSLVGNPTGATANAQAVAVPSCATSASALNYTIGTGFSCNAALVAPAGSLSGATLAAGVTASSLTSFGPAPVINQPTTNGVTNGSAAGAGVVGEYISSNIPQGSAVALTTGVAKNITSVVLTAGDWFCRGVVNFYPAGTTTISDVAAWMGTIGASIPTRPNGGSFSEIAVSLSTGVGQSLSAGGLDLNLSGSTIIYLESYAAFGTSTMTAGGFIGCRRMR